MTNNARLVKLCFPTVWFPLTQCGLPECRSGYLVCRYVFFGITHMAEPIKITIVIRSLERGGTETHLLRTLPIVASNDFLMSIFCFERPGELSEEMRRCGIKVVTPPISGWFTHVPLMLKPFTTMWTCVFFFLHLFRRSPDVVHFFLPASYLMLAPISLLHVRSKKIMSRRSMNKYLEKYPKWVRKVEFFLHKKMSVVLANSRAVLKQLEYMENVPAEKLRLVYNGIDETENVSRRDFAVRADLGIKLDAVVLATVANLLPYKGYQDLIEACGFLSKSFPTLPDWHLIVIGNDSVGMKKELENLAVRLGVSQRLHFVGKRTDVNHYLAAVDIGVLVSHEEGFSNAVIEEMSAGLPMIVSDVGGNPEAVVHGETGLVVPAKAPKELAKAIAYLLQNPSVAKEMGLAGKKRVRECFSIEQSAEGYRSVYRSLGHSKMM